MAVSKRLRFEILTRDGEACRKCGRRPPDVELQVDHVIPVALGGSDDPTNLQTLCRDCNSGKSSVPADAPLVADVAADALRWSAAMQEVSDNRRAARSQAKQLQDEFIAKWNVWTYNSSGQTVELSSAWRSSIDQFLGAGLDMGEILELVDVAMEARTRDTWRYFCGCCWRRVTQNQEAARALIEYEENSAELLRLIQEGGVADA